MSAIESNRAQGNRGSLTATPPRRRDSTGIDVPGILAGQIGDLYAAAERERRVASLERAIARAKGAA